MKCFPFLILCAVYIIKGASAETTVASAPTTVNCSVSVSDVPEGQPVEIICKFSKDLRTLMKSFTVERETAPKKGVSVVRCDWNNETKSYECTPRAGYVINETDITDTVRVLIPRVVKAQEGNYSCQIPSASSATSCQLKVKESPFVTSCHVGRVLEGKPANIMFYFNKDLKLANPTFIIFKQSLSAGKPDKTVLNCFQWQKEKPECDRDDAYELRYNSTTLTLHVSSASKEHEGRYTALVQSKLLGRDTPCMFMLAENERGQTTEYSQTTTHSLAGTILAVEVVSIFGFILFFIFTRMKPRRNGVTKGENATSGENVQLTESK